MSWVHSLGLLLRNMNLDNQWWRVSRIKARIINNSGRNRVTRSRGYSIMQIPGPKYGIYPEGQDGGGWGCLGLCPRPFSSTPSRTRKREEGTRIPVPRALPSARLQAELEGTAGTQCGEHYSYNSLSACCFVYLSAIPKVSSFHLLLFDGVFRWCSNRWILHFCLASSSDSHSTCCSSLVAQSQIEKTPADSQGDLQYN